jgi:DNA gyrase inhibitor GyrI
MTLKIETIPACKIAYIRQIGPYGVLNKQAMKQMKEFARANALFMEESILLGIAQDNPVATKPEDCRYDACLVISEDYCVNDNHVNSGELTAGKYAVFTIAHTAQAVQKAWCDIFPELQKQGYRLNDTKPIIERYAVKMVHNHTCELCVPVY